MTSCEKYYELISCLLDGEISDADRAALDEHLESCESCRSLYEAFNSISAETKELDAEPPKELLSNVMDQINGLKINDTEDPFSESDTQIRKKSRRPVILRYVALAACLAVIILTVPALFEGRFSNSTASVPQYKIADTATAAQAESKDEKFAAAGTEQQSAKQGSAPAASSAAATARTDLTGGGEGAGIASGSNDTAARNGDGTAGVSPSGGEVSLMLAPNADYYVTITVKGSLPQLLDGYEQKDQGDGVYYIYVSRDVAQKLIEEGYSSAPGKEDANEALVIYSVK